MGVATALCFSITLLGALRAPVALAMTLPPGTVFNSEIRSRALLEETGAAFTVVTEQIEYGGTTIDPFQGMTDYVTWIQARPVELRVGWPLRCTVATSPTRSEVDSTSLWSRFVYLWEHGIPYGAEDPWVVGRSTRRIPVRPIWIGFLGDLLLYTLLVMALLWCIAALRSWRWKRRGLCPSCAYPIASARCSECGRVHQAEFAG